MTAARPHRQPYRAFPLWLFTDPKIAKLNPIARHVWLVLWGICGNLGLRQMSNLAQVVSEHAGISLRSAYRVLQELRDFGAIVATNDMVWVCDVVEHNPAISTGQKHKAYVAKELAKLSPGPVVDAFRARYGAYIADTLSDRVSRTVAKKTDRVSDTPSETIRIRRIRGTSPPSPKSGEGGEDPPPPDRVSDTLSGLAGPPPPLPETEKEPTRGQRQRRCRWPEGRADLADFPNPHLPVRLAEQWEGFVDAITDEVQLTALAGFIRSRPSPWLDISAMVGITDMAHLSPESMVVGLMRLLRDGTHNPSDRQLRVFATRAEEELSRARADRAAGIAAEAGSTVPLPVSGPQSTGGILDPSSPTNRPPARHSERPRRVSRPPGQPTTLAALLPTPPVRIPDDV